MPHEHRWPLMKNTLVNTSSLMFLKWDILFPIADQWLLFDVDCYRLWLIIRDGSSITFIMMVLHLSAVTLSTVQGRSFWLSGDSNLPKTYSTVRVDSIT